MKKAILTIAIVLSAASAFADDHREYRGDYDNGHHYGQYRNRDSHGRRDCRGERDWKHRPVVYNNEYRVVQEIPLRQVAYVPEQRYSQPTVLVSLPALPVSFSFVLR